jgi:hypothetical protein
MIQAITGTNLTVYLQTEDNRIDTSVAKSQIRHLFKLQMIWISLLYILMLQMKILKIDILNLTFYIMQRLIFI